MLAPLRPTAAPAPDVTLYELGGDPVPLREAAGGRVTLINLWASWCPPCRRKCRCWSRASGTTRRCASCTPTRARARTPCVAI
ncbi:redoxin family protein [Alcanivorax sp. IO_7]|nr:redoxin family protein [Alcanivorax sp. IO_7]